MNKQTARNLLMELIYGEISDPDREKLEHYLQAHPEMQQELDELRDVHGLLQEAPEPETQKELLPIAPQSRSFTEWMSQAAMLLPPSKAGKSLVAAAACLILFFIGSAAANLNIHSTKSGFSFHLGYGKQAAQIQPEASNRQTKQVALTKNR